MDAKNFRFEHLVKMAHSHVRNYVVPGLSSSLIGGLSEHGVVRLFECERDHQEEITPHSHRFDFMCWVLAGEVRNRIWTRRSVNADWFAPSTVRCGGMGRYELEHLEPERWAHDDYLYKAGECYSMLSHQVHSIHFSRGAKVLFFEGPQVTDASFILEPFVNGVRIPTFRVDPWMFERVAIPDGDKAEA